jgi:hypothetical protein
LWCKIKFLRVEETDGCSDKRRCLSYCDITVRSVHAATQLKAEVYRGEARGDHGKSNAQASVDIGMIGSAPVGIDTQVPEAVGRHP